VPGLYFSEALATDLASAIVGRLGVSPSAASWLASRPLN
jgi:hypothetical protein